MIFSYVVKLSHLHNAPFALFKMAHLKREVAYQAGDLCMASESIHPRIQRLQATPLREQYQRWRYDGADLEDDDMA